MAASPGKFVIGDIVDFSLRDGKTQVAIISKMWNFLEEHKFLDRREGVLTNGTGDGALIVFPSNENFDYEEILGFAVDWINFMKDMDPSIQLRVGIHEGAYQTVRIQSEGRQELVGTGINDCSRIAAIGDAGHIVISEQFYQEWLKWDRNGPYKFSPGRNSEPFEVFVKHEVPQLVRYYNHAGSGKAPRRLRNFQLIADRFNRALKVIEQTIQKSLQHYNMTKTTRVSVLGRVRNNEDQAWLRCTGFRVSMGESAAHPGRTKYFLNAETETAKEGPICCLINNQISLSLLNFLDEEQYENHILDKWKVSREQFQRWNYFPKLFLMIPFGLDKKTANGVLCLDVLEPIHELGGDAAIRELFLALGEDIFNKDSFNLAALWNLRLQ